MTLNHTFLNAQGVNSPVAGITDAIFGTGGHDGMVDRQTGLFRDVKLPAHLTHKRQTHGPHLHKKEKEKLKIRSKFIIRAEEFPGY